ncbi:MAG: GAF domain-containing protein [Propionibacteriales bacterium]|nr:GAF domain-containing protein [Propionibacteriales bacterium]
MTTSPSPEVASLMVALGDALGSATRPTSLDTELSKAVAGVRTLFSAAACSCARVQPDGATLKFVAADGAGADSILGVEMALGRGIAGWVAMSGQPMLTSEVAQDSRFARDIAESTNYIPETILAAPLVDEDGEVVGVLEVLDPQSRGGHSGHDLDTLGVIAAQVASIIRLCEVYDALGDTLLRGLAKSGSTDDFAGALAEVSDAAEGRQELVALAKAFHELSSTGPAGAALAARVLTDVAAFARTRR